MGRSWGVVRLFTLFSGACAAVWGTPFTTIDFPGATETRLTDINNSGEIAGTYFDASGSGTFLLHDGVYTPLVYPGALATVAVGLSNSGEVAGWYLDDSARQHGFLWQGGTYSNVNVPGADSTFLADVNSSGQLLGGYCNGEACHGFFTGPGGIHSFDVPGADTTNPTSINDRGVIVGYSLTFGFGTGFIRATDGTLTSIEVHDPNSPVGLTAPSGINSNGLVVGWTGFKYHGFLWQDGKLTPFNVSPINLPSGINDYGQVVGTYHGDTGDHGFLAQVEGQVPEPGSLALVSLGVAALASVRRRCCSKAARSHVIVDK